MNSARSILTKEIWSRRTDKRILLWVGWIVLVLTALLVALVLYVFVSSRWLTSSGRKKAQVLLERSEKVRFGTEEEAKGSSDRWTEVEQLDRFTVADRLVQVQALLLIMDAGHCREVELRLSKSPASFPHRDWLVKWNQQQCKQYERDVKSLRESLQNAPAFQFSGRQDLWQRTSAK